MHNMHYNINPISLSGPCVHLLNTLNDWVCESPPITYSVVGFFPSVFFIFYEYVFFFVTLIRVCMCIYIYYTIIISLTYPRGGCIKSSEIPLGCSAPVEGTAIGSGLKRVGAFGGVFILTVTVTTD